MREKSVAAFMAAQRLNSMGQIIHSAPDMESGAVEDADRIIFLLSSGLSKDEIKETFLSQALPMRYISEIIRVRRLEFSLFLRLAKASRLWRPN